MGVLVGVGVGIGVGVGVGVGVGRVMPQSSILSASTNPGDQFDMGSRV